MEEQQQQGIGPSRLQMRRHSSMLQQQQHHQQITSTPQQQQQGQGQLPPSQTSISQSQRNALPQLQTQASSQVDFQHSPQQIRRPSQQLKYGQNVKTGQSAISPVISSADASSNLANAMTHTMITQTNSSGSNFSPSSYMPNTFGGLRQRINSIESFTPLSLGSLSDLQLPSSRRQSVVMSDAPPLPPSLSTVNLMGQSTHSQVQHQQQQQLQLQQFQQQQQQELHQQQQLQQQQLQQQQQQEMQTQQQHQRQQQQQQQQHQNQQHCQQQSQHTQQHQNQTQPSHLQQQQHQNQQRMQRQQNRKEDQQQQREQLQEKEDQHEHHVQQQRAQQAQQTQQTQRQEEQQHQQQQQQQTQQQKQMSMNLDLDMAIDSGLFGQAMGEHGHQLFAGDLVNPAGGSNSNSTLTEFTKRRNWSQRIIEEIQDFLHILTPNGKIRYASPNSKVLTGYTPEELIGRMITDYIHTDDSHLFIREFNESIASGHKLRFYYRFKAKDETYVIFEATGHPHFADQRQVLGANTSPNNSVPSNNSNAVCGGFFMMARQYPTRNAALLDSFLEHKIENERLTQRISELKQEEQEDQQAQAKARLRAGGSVSSGMDGSARTEVEATAYGAARTQSNPILENQDPKILVSATSHSMPPPAKPNPHGTMLTRQNLDSFDNTVASRQDSLREKMARFEGATHVETIEMLTGLRYREGERSKGISTGDTSPSLIRGDAGVPMPVDKESRSGGERKKKVKVANEYVCTDCGTLESPEWRKGPTGPKTLCNACGLRWAKKEKKRGSLSLPSGGLDLTGQVLPVNMPLLKQSNGGNI